MHLYTLQDLYWWGHNHLPKFLFRPEPGNWSAFLVAHNVHPCVYLLDEKCVGQISFQDHERFYKPAGMPALVFFYLGVTEIIWKNQIAQLFPFTPMILSKTGNLALYGVYRYHGTEGFATLTVRPNAHCACILTRLIIHQPASSR